MIWNVKSNKIYTLLENSYLFKKVNTNNIIY
jgi:hypothetical protein